MKKTQKIALIPLFFIVFIIIFSNFYSFFNFFEKDTAMALQQTRKYEIEFQGRNYTYYQSELVKTKEFSKIREKMMKDLKNVKENFQKLINIGLSQEEAINYIFPEVEELFKKFSNKNNIQPKPEKVKIIKNKCEIIFFEGEEGLFIDKESFYKDAKQQLFSGKNDVKIKINTKKYKSEENLREKFKQKSCFSTNFKTSAEARKNNIKVALSKFDGVLLDEGEILSFNQTTGKRDDASGYMPAKIISQGTFVEGYGGGVCQVSTTLYNACLLAGLEILEVHNHSLPVSYIEPSFDAMVNSGSSDLVVRNNSGGKILITTSSENDICKVKIFGLKNKYKITRISEKIKIIPAEEEIVDTDYKKYGNINLEIGEEKRLSYAKDGFYSNGYLNFYNEHGELIKTQKIRENKYNSTKGIIVKRIG